MLNIYQWQEVRRRLEALEALLPKLADLEIRLKALEDALGGPAKKEKR